MMADSATLAALLGLAAAAFGAATPLPLQSEPVVVGLLLTQMASPLLILAVASVANTAGSCLTYALGRAAARAGASAGGGRWMPLKPEGRARAERWFSRWGRWSLLLSWAPGGDLVVALAGLMRVPVWQMLPLVALAKTGRYAALAWITLQAVG